MSWADLLDRDRDKGQPSGAPPTPETFDQLINASLPDDVEADFAPIAGTDGGDAIRQAVADPFQADSLRARSLFDSAVAISATGDEERAARSSSAPRRRPNPRVSGTWRRSPAASSATT